MSSTDLHEFYNCDNDDFEIPIATISTPPSDPTKETTSTTQSIPPSSSLGTQADESDDGFRTPTNMTIPLTTVCPPAPRKSKSRKRLLQNERQEEGDLQLVIDVGVLLDFLEDEDRKRMRIKRVRRQEEVGNDTTTATT